MLNPNATKIIIAGASGYIGKAVIPKLLQKFPNATITALSRSQQMTDDPRVQWKACDLFSLKSIETALPESADLALYLVHSMGPTANLDQGSFADYDLILADNFARALSKINLKQLIYLGGIVPQDKNLSLHLQSRLEVEETFAQFKLPMTVFRAGLILGPGGSSFQILLKLVKRLPIMICPAWTQTLNTPVDLETVLTSLTEASLNNECIGKIYDLAGCEPITYLQMMRETAERLGVKRFFFTVPFFTPTLSRMWVCLITGTPKDLVYPLVESLEHEMVARKDRQLLKGSDNKSYKELLEGVSVKTYSARSLFQFRARSKTVRSVQRLPLPQGKNADWVKAQYFEWLPRYLTPFLKVQIFGSSLAFCIFGSKVVLIELKLNTDRSNADRQLLYIVKGFLVHAENRGRLEFRVVLNRKYVLAAIHDYQPMLPWYVYVYTQAKAHLIVMNSFRRYLQKQK